MLLGKNRGITGATSIGLLTAVGAETDYDTTTTIEYAINGDGYRVTAITNGNPTALTDANTGNAYVALAINQGCCFVWGFNAAGTVVVAQSEIKALDAVTAEFLKGLQPQFPVIPDTMCPFAYQVVKNDSTGSAYTWGTGNWNQTGITDLIVDIHALPDRPKNETTA